MRHSQDVTKRDSRTEILSRQGRHLIPHEPSSPLFISWFSFTQWLSAARFVIQETELLGDKNNSKNLRPLFTFPSLAVNHMRKWMIPVSLLPRDPYASLSLSLSLSLFSCLILLLSPSSSFSCPSSLSLHPRLLSVERKQRKLHHLNQRPSFDTIGSNLRRFD